MAARPRKNNVRIPNLYPLYSRKVNKIYWRYKHPVTGKFHGLGDNEEEAKAIAIEANSRLAEHRTRQITALSDRIAATKGKAVTVSTWVNRYWSIQKERLKAGEIRPNTYKQKNKPVQLLLNSFAMKELPAVNVRDIASILDAYKASGQNRMGQVVRSVLIDVFKEAQHAGEVPPGYNPALATKQPRRRITRQRLNLEEWQRIFEIADANHKYMGNAMLLAVVTGQRLGDIAKMRFEDIWNEHLHVVQQKTGVKLAIPLSLRCQALDISLQEVIARCRDYVISPWLIHFFRNTTHGKRGGQVTANTLTTNFSRSRDKANIEWGDGTAATFHEQRSLSERLYKNQGVDTKRLLGHKSQRQTDQYNDDRGKNWCYIIA
ncbi:phage integrase Arm DNA-binding domain-containing protein [Erwinia sp. OPT-41]|uniref:Phage integrase Arm DNA-binding domain-containing protein n=1 Tax=Erwinia plantamica TaxID=3237104 RepID=A0ABW7CL54_9GAMM